LSGIATFLSLLKKMSKRRDVIYDESPSCEILLVHELLVLVLPVVQLIATTAVQVVASYLYLKLCLVVPREVLPVVKDTVRWIYQMTKKSTRSIFNF
jgi:hypothetical protein